MARPTPDTLETVAARLDATPVAEFAQWSRDGAALPHPIYAPIEGEWRDLVGAFGAPRPSAVYDAILKNEMPAPTTESIAAADHEHLVGYVTFIIRGERFCDGHIAGAQEGGLLSGILRRFAALDRL